MDFLWDTALRPAMHALEIGLFKLGWDCCLWVPLESLEALVPKEGQRFENTVWGFLFPGASDGVLGRSSLTSRERRAGGWWGDSPVSFLLCTAVNRGSGLKLHSMVGRWQCMSVRLG